MPKNAKEKTDELNMKKTVEKSTNKKTTKTSSKSSNTKSSTLKTEKKTPKKKTTTRNTKATSTKKSTTKKKTSTNAKSKKKPISQYTTTVEYYDLPFRYNQTVVKILAQTPNMLFIYWDISDDDRKAYEDNFGKDFFYHSKPVLLIKNLTMNYSFEIDINDFANSWYLNINDANCEYKVELGRRFITNSTNSLTDDSHLVNFSCNDYVYVASSNEIETPNNHILFDKLGHSVFFRNVKTNFIEEKNISSLSYLRNIGKLYHVYDLYKQIYKDELESDELGLDLPSSNSSSNFK